MIFSIHQIPSDSVKLTGRNGWAVPLVVRTAEEERPKRRKLSVMRDKGRLAGSP